MGEKSQWSIRHIRCAEQQVETQLLVEWRVEKGKKVLHSISCQHPQLLAYSGADCEWGCLQKLSPKKDKGGRSR